MLNQRKTHEASEKLFIAIENSDHAALVKAIHQGAHVNAENNGTNALFMSVKKGNLDIIETLLAKKVNVNFQNKFGLTALHSAMIGQRKDIVEVLIRHGADVDIKNNCGITAIDYAVQQENIELLLLLKDLGLQDERVNLLINSIKQAEGRILEDTEKVCQNIFSNHSVYIDGIKRHMSSLPNNESRRKFLEELTGFNDELKEMAKSKENISDLDKLSYFISMTV